MTDVQQLAAAAHLSFSNKAYDEALAALEKLRQLKESDPRIRPNIAVVQFYRDGCANPQQLLDILLEGQHKTDINNKETPKPDISTNGSPKTEGSAPSEMEADSSFTSLQSAYLSYNRALIYFQLRQYSYALELLEGLFPSIEALPEDLAIKTSFLLIDVYHIHKQAAKVAHIIAHLEKNFTSNQRGGESAPTPTKGGNDSQSSPSFQNTSFSPGEFNLLLQLYKLKLSISTKDFAQAKRIIKSATDLLSHLSPSDIPLTSSASTTLSFLKANLEYARGNYPKALKLLSNLQKKASSDGVSQTALLHNDKGCLYYRLQKYSASSFSLSKALKEHTSVISEDNNRKNLSVYNRERRDELFYNQGLQLLLIGNYELALQCFHEAAMSYYRKPKLWLRMAECCVLEFLASLRNLKQKNHSPLLQGILMHDDEARHILLPTGPILNMEHRTAKEKSLSLEYGRECLRNALFLLSRASAASSKESKTESVKPTEGEESSDPSSSSSVSSRQEPPAKRRHLQDTCLLNMAFIALCTEDPVVAHSAASEVISNTTSPDARFLAHVYAAESLCLLNKPVEAAAHLSPSVLLLKGGASMATPLSPRSALSTPAASSTSSLPDGSAFSRWHSQGVALSATDARYTLHINLACVHILQDKIVQAQKCLSQAITLCPTRHEGILLLVYIELCKGNTQGALDLLRRGRSAGLHVNALLNNPTTTNTQTTTVKNENK